MHWTVGRRIVLDQAQHRVVPALRAESDFRRAIVDYLAYLGRPDAETMRSRDSTFALSRMLVERLRDSAATAEPRAIWAEAAGALTRWESAKQAERAAQDLNALGARLLALVGGSRQNGGGGGGAE